jgi:YgiT-type zinc finger domain-containing protein
MREPRAGVEACSVCGATLEEQTIKYAQVLDGRQYLFADVLVLVCSQCGEQYRSPDTGAQIQKTLSEREADEMVEVPLNRLERATAWGSQEYGAGITTWNKPAGIRPARPRSICWARMPWRERVPRRVWPRPVQRGVLGSGAPCARSVAASCSI